MITLILKATVPEGAVIIVIKFVFEMTTKKSSDNQR